MPVSSISLFPFWLAVLTRLPFIVEAASSHNHDWSILVLSPVNTPFDFFRNTPAFCIPLINASPQTIKEPTPLASPPSSPLPAAAQASTDATAASPVQLPRDAWQRSPPTYHAFGWVYRRSLMRRLVDAFHARQPPLEPLDIWVWEVAAAHACLDGALCLSRPLVDAGKSGGQHSIKDAQDDQAALDRIYRERGYGK